MLTENEKKQIDVWVSKFPEGKQRSAVLMALRVVQDQRNHLTEELMHAIALYLNIAVIDVLEVASFYSLYRHKATGRYVIKVCDSLSCCLRGAESVLDFVQQELKVGLNETTPDGLFTIAKTECLAACTDAPVVIVNDKDYYKKVTKKSLRELIGTLRSEND